MKKTEKKGLDLFTAYKIMGRLIIDIDSIDRFLGFIPKNLHPIPFTERELEIHANEGHRFYLEVNRINGQPLNIEALAKIAFRKKGNRISPSEYLFWPTQFNDDGTIKPEAWFYGDRLVMSATPKLGWRIASEEVISETLSLNYLDQTDALIDYHKKIYKKNLPEHYKEAIAQWKAKRPVLKKELLAKRNDNTLCKELVKAKVTSLIRESYVSTVYRHALIYEAERRKILQSHWSWSNTASSGGYIVSFGGADADGASAFRPVPGSEWFARGAVFSRHV